ncbi:MAG: Calx-beta domain-containing protein [Chakrabartia sp.]
MICITLSKALLRSTLALMLAVTAMLSWTAPALAQHTSTECPAQTATVTAGGTVTINISDCELPGFGGLGAIDGGSFGPNDLENHGTATTRRVGGGPTTQWFLDYAHNGTTGIGSTDVFELSDGSLLGNGDIRFTITINASASPITVAPASLSTLTAGTPFSQTLTASGGLAPYTYSLQSGVLPVGLSLSSGGVLSGTPTQRGGYSFSVRATDNTSPTAQFFDKGYAGTVQSPTLTLSPSTYTVVLGAATSFSLSTTGGVTPHSYQTEPFVGVAPAPGLTMSAAGVISGTPTTVGSTTTAIRVTDASTPSNAAYFELESLTINVIAAPTVSIAVAPASVSEDGATNLVYTVTRSINLSSPTAVNITASGTAASGSDYTGGVATVTIPANATTATVTIDPSADTTGEPNETVILTVAAGAGYTVGAPSSATGTITNDDGSSTYPGCATRNVTVANGGTVRVDLSTCHFFGLGVLATAPANGTATAGPGPVNYYDYTHNGNSATSDRFAVLDDNSQTIVINVTISAPTSSIVVSPTNLSAMTAGTTFAQTLTSTGGTGPYTYTVSTGAFPTGLSISSTGVISGTPTQRGSYSVGIRSQDSLGAFTVKGYTGTVAAATLTLASGTGTAIQGVAFSQTLATTNGVAPFTYQLETGSLPSGITLSSTGVLSGTTSSAVGPYSVTIRVTDSSTGTGINFQLQPFTLTVSPPPSVSIAVSPASVAEDGAANLVYTVTRSLNLSSPTTVNITTSGTATSGSDYTGSIATATILSGATTATITIDPTVDATVEPDETVILTVAAGTGYTVGAPASATGTILNDETTTLSINDVSLGEGNAGTTNATFSVTLSAPAGAGGVSFDIATANGTATAGSDYVAQSLTGQVIAAGNSSATFTVAVNGDLKNELAETFFVNITNVTGASVADGQGLGTINNDDSAPSLSSLNVTRVEGNSGTSTATFTISLSAASGQTVTVNYATSNGTATAGSDYTAASGTLTFVEGETSKTVAVTIAGDTVPENDEAFSLTLSGATNATLATASVTGTITNDDAPVASISVAPSSVVEDGAPNLIYTVTLDQAGVAPITVNISSGGTAASGSDYSGGVTSLVFATGVTSQTVTINPTADTGVEANETVILTLASGTGYSVGAPASATGTISNDDLPTVSLGVSPTSVAEDSGTGIVFTATLNQPSLSATTILLGTSGAATSGTDYTGASSSIVIAAGLTTGSITITPTSDSVVEPDENVTLTVNASAAYVIGAPSNATATITNDDVPTASITVAPASVQEDGAANLIYTVTLNQAANAPITVNVTSSGTAVSGNDYSGSVSSLTFATGVTSQTVTIDPSPDTGVEANETVILTLASGTGYSVGAPTSATGTISNDDAATLSIDDVSLAEGDSGNSIATFTVSLSTAAGPGGVSFDIATANGTATAGSDYAAQALTGQIIPAGSSSATFAVTVNGDTGNEPNETFLVTVSNVTGATIADGQGQGTITNDDAVPALSIGNATVVEGNAGTVSASFTVTLNAVSGQNVAVDFATANGTATAGGDYVSQFGTLTFTPGQTSKTVLVTVNGDTTPESDEAFTVVLSNAVNATLSASTGLGTITNDDVPVIVGPASVPSATVAVAYSQVISATGGTGPYSFTLSSGALPAGLTLSPAGLLSGTPTAGGSFGFTVTATDSSAAPGPYAGSTSYTLVVSSPLLSLPTTGLSNGALNAAYAAPLLPATGGTAPYSYAVTAGNLPAGLTLTSGGTLGGTPTAFGAFSFTVTATDSSTGTGPYTVSQTYNVTIIDAAPIAGAASTSISYNAGSGPITLTLSGGAPTSIAITTPPANGAAVISGTVISYQPNAGFAGVDSFAYTASNAGGTSAPATVSITVGGPTITVSAAGSLSAVVGTPYSQTFSWSGGTAPYSAYQVSNLPAGLSITGSSANSVTISGTPRASGSFALNAVATDSSTGTGPFTIGQIFTLNVGAPNLLLTPNAGAFTAPYATPYTQTFVASGGVGPYQYSAAGALPVGVTLNLTSGILSGTPTTTGAFSFTVVATDTASSGPGAPFSVSSNYTLTVAAPTITIAPGTLVNATAASPYATPLVATGGVAPYSFTLTSGALPSGLTLSTAGVLNGTPTATGTSSFTVQARDANAQLGTAAYTVVVVAPTLVVTPATLRPATIGIAYSQALTTSGGIAPYSYAVSTGSLPAGLTLGATTGVISGTPTSAGTSNFAIRVQDSTGGTPATATLSLSLTVSARPNPANDPEVKGIVQAQVDATRRFASTQIGNFSRRLENMHGGEESSGGGLQNGLRFAPTPTLSRCLETSLAGNDQNCASIANVVAAAAQGGGNTAAAAPTGQDSALPYTVWTEGSIRFGERDPTTGQTKLEFETDGVSVGIDHRFGPSFAAGIGFGYGKDKVDVGEDGSQSKGTAKAVVVYASKMLGETLYIDAMTGYQWLDYDLRRYVTSTGGLVTGQRSGTQWFASVTAGADFRSNHWQIMPYTRLDITRAQLKGYAESGDPIFGLRYLNQDIDFTALSLGLRVNYDYVARWGTFSPLLRLEYQNDIERSGEASLTYIDQVTGPFFAIPLSRRDRSQFTLGVGGKVELKPSLSLDLEYVKKLNSGYDSNDGIQIGIGYKF